MKSISVKNFRSIENSGRIELKPLTVILGRNSAGKSSFVRLFPLIKQTIEIKTAEPLLWYGDYVDFGDYAHTVNSNHKNEPIVLSFTLDMDDDKRHYYLYRLFRGVRTVDVEMHITEKNMKYINVEFEDQKIQIDYSRGKVAVIINGQDDVFKDRNLEFFKSNMSLLPEIIERKRKYSEDILVRMDNSKMEYALENIIYSSKNRYLYRKDINRITLGSQQIILSQIQNYNKDKFEKYKLHWKKFQKINNMLIAIYLPEIIDAINLKISDEMKNTYYLKPIRAMVDRYYRVQGVSIDELNADGSNLPMMLKNMKKIQLVSFERWCKEKFGVIFSVTEFEGHISLVIKSDIDGDILANVADTGYGYSQILPIIMLLWNISQARMSPFYIQKTIVIEQPELHLHPAYQIRLIDVFVSIIEEAKKNKIDLKIIFETHSESMINEIGYLVSKQHIDPEDVKLLLFDKKNDGTIISEKTFDKDGLLEAWPIGFFAAER